MKKLLLFLLLVMGFTISHAQQSSVEVYIQFIADYDGEMRIETGKVKNPLVDSLLAQVEIKNWLKKKLEPTDVLNRLSLEGWQLVSSMAVPTRRPFDKYAPVYYYLLKRQITFSSQQVEQLKAIYK